MYLEASACEAFCPLAFLPSLVQVINLFTVALLRPFSKNPWGPLFHECPFSSPAASASFILPGQQLLLLAPAQNHDLDCFLFSALSASRWGGWSSHLKYLERLTHTTATTGDVSSFDGDIARRPRAIRALDLTLDSCLDSCFWRIAKRAPTSPKSNKRRRFDEPGEPDQENAGNELNIMIEPCSPADDPAPPPSTPKRARIAPEQLPLGLARSDFHNVYMPRDGELNPAPAANQEECGDGDEWSAEDDRILVELILDKLRLSKTDWQDCARSLGKDRHSVSKRWKSLLNQGDVGLKARGAHRRPRLHATWR
ncbi:hypothetical protein HIM_02534 [Hirsutella minnesotensis 3608]|nr:hypothetical protein HIM_02534 [Hirsutella minnesotensis 3608]